MSQGSRCAATLGCVPRPLLGPETESHWSYEAAHYSHQPNLERFAPSLQGRMFFGAFVSFVDEAFCPRYILISAAKTIASAISRMDFRNFMLFC